MINKNVATNFQHPKGLCYVSEKHKLIFVPIPKNASTTVRHLLTTDFFTSNIVAYQEELDAGNYHAFTIVRDPLKRFVSGYLEVCIRATGDSPHILLKDFYWKKGKSRFVRFLDELEESIFDAHMSPQKYFLTDYANKSFSIDTYVDIGNVSKFLPSMFESYGILPPDANIVSMNVRGTIKKSVNLSDKINRKIDIKYPGRTLYYIMDYITRSLQKRVNPVAIDVYAYIEHDKLLAKRVNNLIDEDVQFLKALDVYSNK